MARRVLFIRSSAGVLAALLGAAALAACNKSDNASVTQASAAPALPLVTSGAAPSAAAPSVDALPAAAPAPVVRVADPDQDYAYLDQAYYQGAAFEDAPPDYAFSYDGVSPWAWQGADDAYEFAEPVDDGYRYYYYQPGAAWPYLIRDGGYAYGFDNGQLVIVYDSDGRPMGEAEARRRAPDAGRYLARAQALYRAARSSEHRSVVAANWAAGRSEIAAQQAQWSAARSRQSAWRAYDASHAAQQAGYWQAERARRQQSAAGFAQWRQTNFQGPPPTPVGRVQQQASRDNAVRPAQAPAQAPDQAAQRFAQAPAADRDAAMHALPRPDNARAEQDQARQVAEQQRAQQDRARVQQQQVRQQADNAARAQRDLAQQGAQQQRAQQQQRQQAQQGQVRAKQQQARQQADAAARGQRDQQRQLADQQRAQQTQQLAAQQQQQRQQAMAQQQQQRQAAEQQRHQALAQAQPPRPAPAPAQPHPQQAQQQRQPPQPAKPQPQAREAQADAHREHHD